MLGRVCSGERIPAFDLIGQRYEQSFIDRSEQERAITDVLQRLTTGARVLDLGCGSGTPTAEQVVKAGMEVVGIDESEEMLRLARERVPSATFHQGDIRRLGDLGDFDAATAFFSLPMLSKQEITALLRDVRARLRGPGMLAVSTVEGDYDAMPITFLGVDIPTTAFPPNALADEISAAGFQIEKMWSVEATVEPSRSERQIYLVASADDASS